MTKTLAAAKRQERVKFKVPRSVQGAIPIRRIWPDGIFQVGNQYSKSWSFTDINYAIADKDDKMAMFLDYCTLLNALDSGASAKITIHNRRIDKEDFERSVLLPLHGDALDHYREEFNEMLRAQVTGTSNSMVRERYLTVSIVKRNKFILSKGTGEATRYAQFDSYNYLTAWVTSQDEATELVTDANGHINALGLDADTYSLIETETLPGYNLLDEPITVVIAADGSVTYTGADATNATTINIKNQTGSLLPSTGGMGTTILYIAGAALVLGAGVTLVVRRRMNSDR